MDKPLKKLVKDTEKKYRSKAFLVSYRLHQLWAREYKLYSGFEKFESAQAEEKNLSNQDFKAAPALKSSEK